MYTFIWKLSFNSFELFFNKFIKKVLNTIYFYVIIFWNQNLRIKTKKEIKT